MGIRGCGDVATLVIIHKRKLAKFGYRSESKVEKSLRILLYFGDLPWSSLSKYGQFQKNKSSKFGDLELLFSTEIFLYELHWVFFFWVTKWQKLAKFFKRKEHMHVLMMDINGIFFPSNLWCRWVGDHSQEDLSQIWLEVREDSR